MGITKGGARRAVTIIAATLVASAAFSTSAMADPVDPDAPAVIGPSDLTAAAPMSASGSSGVEVLVQNGAGGSYEMPANGRITTWRANISCAEAVSGCGRARLFVLRPS